METIQQEAKKEFNVFPYVEEKIEEKLTELRANSEINKNAGDPNKQDEMLAEARMKIRATEMALHDAEESLTGFSSSREMYLRTVILAKLLAFYKKMEELSIFSAEAGDKKEKDQNFAGMERTIQREVEQFLKKI
jgi:hypothetical protein